MKKNGREVSKLEQNRDPRNARRTASAANRNGQARRPAPTRTVPASSPAPVRQTASGTRGTAERRSTGTPEYRFYVKSKRQAAWKVFLSRLKLFGIAFVCFLVLFAAIFFICLIARPGVDRSVFYCAVSEKNSDDYAVTEIPYDRVYRDGVYYVNLTSLADYCDFVMTGDTGTIRFLTSVATGDSVYFTVDSASARINGQNVTLNAPVRSYGDYIYVPLEFINRYLDGMEASVNPDSRTVSVRRNRTLASLSGSNETVYEPLSFSLLTPVLSESIPYDSLDRAILELTRSTDSPLIPEP